MLLIFHLLGHNQFSDQNNLPQMIITMLNDSFNIPQGSAAFENVVSAQLSKLSLVTSFISYFLLV